MGDLHDERARAMSYLESLQTLERRREITQHLVTDLHHQAEAHAAKLVQLTRELAARDERGRLREEELAQRAMRIGQLEQRVGTLTTVVSQRDAQLQEQRSDTRRQQELQGLRRELTSVNAALEAARRDALAATAQASSQQTALAQHGERTAQLEAWLDAERQRAARLEGELATVRAEMEEWGGVLRSAQEERSGQLARIAAAESHLRELEQQAAAREERVRALQGECATHLARVRELENDLHAAEEVVHRLEADSRGRGSNVTELERFTDTNPALREPARPAEEEAHGAEPVPEGATRLLIHGEDGREVVHVLGRKTSIGRTPDNDLQLDAKFISRHHAVILVGPVNAVIEDLNSTNGVQVNGRRVTRQTLRDGDKIAIGRMLYRFVVRKAPDKR